MRVTYEELKQAFLNPLLKRNVDPTLALECATEFADTTAYGVLSHGINRYSVFILQMDKGEVVNKVNPELEKQMGCIEVYNGHRGIGNITARRMMQRAMDIAKDDGVGIVALRNTSHWMRGGSLGYMAAKNDYIGMCFTNSIAVMPAWGTKECCIGTNPLIIAVPSDPVTMVDFSMSMFSYGQLQNYALRNEQLPIDGGFDDKGNYTRDPATLQKNKQILPMGYWKGSGLSIVLDMIGVALTGGLSVREVTEQGCEKGVTQIFMAIKPVADANTMQQKFAGICDYVLEAAARCEDHPAHIPGHLLESRYQKSIEQGIEVNEDIYKNILTL
ncbi:3-dehydro-L-gulonate 2-dehydrogenase [Anaerobiospirillum thomasii]|uniref:2,3-diketo-L-gulonate reductase n=1 Tax=Anaerobiospirillum thomasii TaxID=179995 RepID=A0A2X0VKA1_9GAMM|nr:3-dehydro-L-gulonate 2-dehydrogenase [Anaerobiospirillum thomasii]SPT69898.1 2,3-diketo-L-gulonate reductase [Anaerobiospirillum thomasii]